MTERKAGPILLGDIGGTYARFALHEAGHAGPVHTLKTCEHESAAAAVRAFLSAADGKARPTGAVIAAAGPVSGDYVRLTNGRWSIRAGELADAFGLTFVHLVNDFEATARSIPLLDADDAAFIGPGEAADDGPICVIGPGTGVGMSALVTIEGRRQPVASEGGHVTMAPADAYESAVLDRLRSRLGHVSAEAVLAACGFVNLYEAISEIEGRPAAVLTPREVTQGAAAGRCRCCAQAMAVYFAMLGTIAGNLALTLDARGGVYIAGGIVPQFVDPLRQSAFRERFEAKGRYRAYLETIPTVVITRPDPVFLALARIAEGQTV